MLTSFCLCAVARNDRIQNEQIGEAAKVQRFENKIWFKERGLAQKKTNGHVGDGATSWRHG